MSFGLTPSWGDQSSAEKLLQEQIAQWIVNPNQGIVDDLIQMVIGCNLTFQH